MTTKDSRHRLVHCQWTLPLDFVVVSTVCDMFGVDKYHTHSSDLLKANSFAQPYFQTDNFAQRNGTKRPYKKIRLKKGQIVPKS